jgi:Zn-dependent metalloprotease
MTRILTGLVALTALTGASFAGSLDWNAARGSVRSLRFNKAEAPQYEGDAKTVAVSFLKDRRALFNGAAALNAIGAIGHIADNPDLSAGEDLQVEVSRVDEGKTVRFVRFQQKVEGLPVVGGDMVVAVRDNGSVSSVQGGYAAEAHRMGLTGFSNVKVIPEAEAFQVAEKDLAAEAPGNYRAIKLVWFVDSDGQLIKSYQVDMTAVKPRGDWRYQVDAVNGKVLSKENLILYHDAPKGALDAQVYMTNPLRDDTLVSVKLERLTGDKKTLAGKYVKAGNGKNPAIQADAEGSFVVDKDSTHFGEVMAYYHIDKVHQNLKEIDPDFTGMDWQIPITAHSKGSFWSKTDNAYYSPMEKAMFILDPNKLNDLHLEASVSYHEYHHAVTDAIVSGLRGTEGKSLHEGYSDYFACALTHDPEIGEWALKPLNRPNMRDLRSQRTYPADIHPDREPHSDGEIWAAACWALRSAIPADKSDFLIHKSRFYLSSNGTFKTAYEGILQADQDFFNGEYADQIKAVFHARGLDSDTVSKDGAAVDVEENLRRRVGFAKLHDQE